MAGQSPRDNAVWKQLAAIYDRHGWTQSPPDPKVRAKRKLKYKRGYEVRFSVAPEDAARVTRLLQQVGFSTGKPYPKANQVRVPLYGREQVERFLNMIGR